MGNQSSIVQNLPQIIDTIIAANPDATSWTEARSGQRKVIKPRTLPQTNSDDCGIFAVWNSIFFTTKADTIVDVIFHFYSMGKIS